MSQSENSREKAFVKSINLWTLHFADPDEETLFHSSFRRSLRLPLGLKIAAYFGLAIYIIYQVYPICAVVLDLKSVRTGSLAQVLYTFVLSVAIAMVEGALRFTRRARQVQGWFIYFGYPLLMVNSAFYTQGYPVVGIASTAGLMLVNPCLGLFINNWLIIAFTNFAIGVLSIGIYFGYFAHSIPAGESFVNCFLIFFAFNFGTIFYYVHERAFRKLYFMEREMRQGKLRWKAVLDSLPVGIILVNDCKKIKLMNLEMRSYLPSRPSTMANGTGSGTDHEELTRFRLPRLPSSLDLECIKDKTNASVTLRRVVERNDDREIGDMIYNMDCTYCPKAFEVKSKYLKNIGPKCYKLIVVKDQSAHEQLVREKMLEKYQRMLLSSIAHEIRNPLNAIEGYSNMILDAVETQTAPLCTKIAHAVDQIDFMLAGAFDLMALETAGSSLQTQASAVQAQSFSIAALVQHMAETVQSSLEGKCVALRTQFSGNVPETICSDDKKYKRILFNLLMNAAKYTSEGSITVLLDYDPGTQMLCTKVVDTGTGIPDDKIGQLFELYGNVEHANQYNPQGMGLGLTLCKRLSVSLGGDITVTTALGRGTTFVFSIKNYAERDDMDELSIVPAERSACRACPDIRLTDPHLILTPRKTVSKQCTCPSVLVVDDEPSNRLVLKSYLRAFHLVPDEADNGRSAVDKVRERMRKSCCKTYQLILMDINMPEMDGTTATTIMLDMFRKAAVGQSRILAVTAANLQTRLDVQNLLAVGFDDVIQKPVAKSTFIDVVSQYL